MLEELKPYNGDNSLWALHELDITRKHKRVLHVWRNTAHFHVIYAGDLRRYWHPVATGVIDAQDKSILGLWSTSAPDKPKVEYTGHVALNEIGPLARKPVVAALHDLASLANSIIAVWD